MKKNIYKNVKLGKGAVIGEFVVLGKPPRGMKNGELATIIGRGAVIRSGSVIYAGNTIGKNFQTGHNVTVRESNSIGDNVSIGSLSCIEHHIKIGRGVRIHSQAFIPEYSVLQDRSWVGPGTVFTNAPHPLCPDVKGCLEGPFIEEDARIGANVTILPGVRIGKNSLVGAGSVVVKDVPPSSVACGNPAKVIKKISELKCRRRPGKKPYDAKRN